MPAVQVVPTHVVGAGDGQAAAGDELHDSPQLRFPVSKELVGEEKTRLVTGLHGSVP